MSEAQNPHTQSDGAGDPAPGPVAGDWGLRQRRTWRVARWMFPRWLAFCYAAAFASWGWQYDGLVGRDGIAPAGEFVHLVKAWGAREDRVAIAAAPTVFLWQYSDAFGKAVCWGGVVAALLVLAGVAQGPLLLLMWAGYLSLATTGDVFMNFQWDALLLEAGLLGVLFAPWRIRSGEREAEADAPGLPRVLLHWLLFRLMFFSGWVKLASGDRAWQDGTALRFHYETQPLPTWPAWWAHHLPASVQTASCWVMFGLELVVPFGIWLGRPGRLVAFWSITSLMVLIAVTGNYTFFNILTVALAVTLVDDSSWPASLLDRLGIDEGVWRRPRPQTVVVAWALGLPLLLLSVAVSLMVFEQRGEKTLVPPAVHQVAGAIAPFRSVNTYGLFSVMTKDRHEIVIEVSADGSSWREIEFKWKPGDLHRRPGFVAPHQPRLDWQMWFAALHPGFVSQRDMSDPGMRWFGRFLESLLLGKPAVWKLVEEPPIPPDEVRHVRCRSYRYRFTDAGERRKTGRWWSREFVGPYSDEFSRPP